MPKTYTVNEIYAAIQGEGIRAGTLNVFVRFTGCNMQCTQEPGDKSPGGFDCDTEFASGRKYTLEELRDEINRVADEAGGPGWIIATGGEPLLQLDRPLCDLLHLDGFKIAIETNGSILPPLDETKPQHLKLIDKIKAGQVIHSEKLITEALDAYLIDWVCVSPKVAEHAIRCPIAHEIRYVRGHRQGLPKPTCKALHKTLSPAFNGLTLDRLAVETCRELIREDPSWRLSVQIHKLIGER